MNGPQIFHITSWPPSVNGLHVPVRGRKILSEEGRIWYRVAGLELLACKPIPLTGQVAIGLRFRSPHNRAYDLDGRSKVAIDLLVKNGVIEDDSNKYLKQIWVAEGVTPGVEISLWPIGARPPAWVRAAADTWEDAA